MRKNVVPSSLFLPLPVLIIGTFDEKGNPNLMNAAWGGIYDTNEIFLCLSSNHLTSKNVLKTKEFSVSFGTVETIKECDYFGIVSGYKEDKIKKSNFHVSKSKIINAPIFDELPVCLECKIKEIKEENETLYIVASVINVSCEENVLTNGKIDLKKFHVASFNPSDASYHSLGDKIANAFNIGKEIK